MKLTFGTVLFMVLCVTICAQPSTTNCPEITVIGPSALTRAGDLMTFTVSTRNGSPGMVGYDWSITAGTIESGQDTATIKVRTTPEMAGTNVTAMVKIRGVGVGCADTASEIAGVAEVQRREAYDSFGKLARDDVKARIDNFYIQLLRNPDYEGLIVVSLNDKETVSYKITYLKNLYHAIDFLRRDPARVSFIISVDSYDTRTTLLAAGASEDVNDLARKIAKEPIVIKGEDFKEKIKALFPPNRPRAK